MWCAGGLGSEVTSSTIPNPFPNKPLFYVSAVQVFKNTAGNEQFIPFPQYNSVSYPFGELSAIIIKMEIVICNLF